MIITVHFMMSNPAPGRGRRFSESFAAPARFPWLTLVGAPSAEGAKELDPSFACASWRRSGAASGIAPPPLAAPALAPAPLASPLLGLPSREGEGEGEGGIAEGAWPRSGIPEGDWPRSGIPEGGWPRSGIPEGDWPRSGNGFASGGVEAGDCRARAPVASAEGLSGASEMCLTLRAISTALCRLPSKRSRSDGFAAMGGGFAATT